MPMPTWSHQGHGTLHVPFFHSSKHSSTTSHQPRLGETLHVPVGGSLGRAAELANQLVESLNAAMQEALEHDVFVCKTPTEQHRDHLSPPSTMQKDIRSPEENVSDLSSFPFSDVKSIRSERKAESNIMVHPAWVEADLLELPSAQTATSVDHFHAKGHAAGRDPPHHHSEASMFVSSPNSHIRLSWDMVCLLVLAYDFTVIPLEFIGLPDHKVFDVMALVTPFFWTVDCVASFFRGYHTVHGYIEKRLKQAMLHYAETWLCFDFVVVAIDWVAFFGKRGVEGGNENALKMARYLRLLRLARCLKLLSAIKILTRVSEVVNHVRSEFALLAIGILRLIGLIMFMCHIVACGWYGISSWVETWDDSWVKKREMETRSFGYRYMTALHWALTQFTPSSMEVHPENAVERFYAICVVLIGMFMFSSLVSNVTNTMLRYRTMNSGRTEARSSLNRWLDQNNVSLNLTARVFRYIDDCEKIVMKGRVHEQDVHILQSIPRRMRDELHDEVREPVVGSHPFFRCLTSTRRAYAHILYERALVEMNVRYGRELFVAEEAADSIFFVVDGQLLYQGSRTSCRISRELSSCRTASKATLPSELNSQATHFWNAMKENLEHFQHTVNPAHFQNRVSIQHTWLSEAALWMKWKHCGSVIAEVNTEVLGLKADKLQDILARELPSREPVHYARLFAAFCCARPDLVTDLPFDKEIVEAFARHCFGQEAASEILGDDGGQSTDTLNEYLLNVLSEHISHLAQRASTPCSLLLSSTIAMKAGVFVHPQDVAELEAEISKDDTQDREEEDVVLSVGIKTIGIEEAIKAVDGKDSAGLFSDTHL